MSTTFEVRQSDGDYVWAEYARRAREVTAVREEERLAYEVYRTAQHEAVAMRRAAQELGLNPFADELGMVEARLWAAREAAVRDWKYQQSVLQNAETLQRAAYDRYVEVSK